MNGRRLIEALLGVYVATLLLPTLAVTGWVAVTSASLGSILAAGLTIAGAGGLAATTMPKLPERVTSLPAVAATILPPLLFLPYLVFAEPAGRAEWLAIVGLLAVVPGMLVPIAGAVIRNQRLRSEATEHAVVTVGDDEDDGFGRLVAPALIIVAGLGGIGMSVFGVAVLAGFDLDGGASIIGSLTAVSGSLVTLFTDDSTELAVTDAGLRVDRSMTPWDDLAGYRVTDDEIKLERARRWLPSRDFDRNEIDDAAFIQALSEFLPETGDETERATTTTN
jgi:hypothetical protein